MIMVKTPILGNLDLRAYEVALAHPTQVCLTSPPVPSTIPSFILTPRYTAHLPERTSW